MSGKLYLVATPIGNLDDITFRAVEILKIVDVIAAEDTRHSLKLLNHLGISKPLISYHRHNEEDKSEVLIKKILDGENIAIITDAGTPAISDPGEEIVKVAIKNNIEIIPIPGACALINALIISGMDTKEFSFYGFLPMNKKLRKNKIEEIKKDKKTIIIYEAPHKILNTLKELNSEIGNINMVLVKELTKIHETVFRGTISEIIPKIENIKGEIIIILEGNKNNDEENAINLLNELNLEEHYKYYENKGLEKKEIIKKIAKDKNVNKNEIYKQFLNK